MSNPFCSSLPEVSVVALLTGCGGGGESPVDNNESPVGDNSLGGIVDAEEKKRTVQRVCDEMGIATDEAIVMGDGANDLKMMGIAGMSVAFRAKPVVREQANVALNFVGLDGILPLLA